MAGRAGPGRGAHGPGPGSPLTPLLSAGDFFRRLWGPRAGWAQAVSAGPLPCAGGALAPARLASPRLASPRPFSPQVLFCAEVTRPRGALPCASPSPKRGRARRSRSSCLGPP